MRNHRNNSAGSGRGFTLIELLVVISIVAILIAILLPALERAKRAGMVIRCASNFRQLGIGLKVYTDQFNHKYPPKPAGVESPDALFHEIFEYAERWYAVLAIRLEDYEPHMRPRSAKWNTVSIPARHFTDHSGPLKALL